MTGAVDVSVGAKRVLHEIGLINMETSGKFVNCEGKKMFSIKVEVAT